MSLASAPLWLGRYRGPSSLRDGKHFDLVGATRASDRQSCVIVRPGPDARPQIVVHALTALADAHQKIVHPSVPELSHAELSGESLFVELACDVAMDGTQLVRSLSEHGARLPHAQAMVIRDAWLDAMEAAHAVGLVLGRASLADLWLSPAGQAWFVGWGAHVSLARDDGTIDPTLGVIETPEVAAGIAPSPSSDFALMLLTMRALASVVEPPPALVRALAGVATAADARAVDASVALDRAFLAGLPSTRPSFAEGQKMLRALDHALGAEPDPAGLARTIESMLARSAEHEVPVVAIVEPTEKVITVDQAGAWVDSESGRTTLGPSLRAILGHLLEQRRAQPGHTSTLWDLLEVGWPGERPLPDAGANRVYAAISRLRKLGLLGALEWHEGGYRISPNAPVTTIG